MTNLSWSEGQQTRAEASRCQRRHFWQFSNVSPRLIQIGGLPRNLNLPGKISSWIVAPPPLIPTKKDPERVKENGDPERTIREIGRGYIPLFHSSLSIVLSVSQFPRNLVPWFQQFVPPWLLLQYPPPILQNIAYYRSYSSSRIFCRTLFNFSSQSIQRRAVHIFQEQCVLAKMRSRSQHWAVRMYVRGREAVGLGDTSIVRDHQGPLESVQGVFL